MSIGLGIGEIAPIPWFEPNGETISGVYVLLIDPVESGQRPDGLSDQLQKIVIFEDGTFEVKQIPELWACSDIETPPKKVDYISGYGTWSLEQKSVDGRKEWLLLMGFSEIGGKEVNQLAHFYLRGHLPPYNFGGFNGGFRIFEFEKIKLF